MATITVEIPDEAMAQLDALRDRLPELVVLSLQYPPVPASIYRAIVDFLAGAPGPEAFLAFQPTPVMRERLAVLLQRSAAGELTPAEQEELDEFERIEHAMILLKAGSLPYVTHTP